MYSLFSGKILQNISVKVLAPKPERSSCLSQPTAGFTLIELLVVILMVGVLSAIAAPGWIGFVNRQQANKANDAILAVLQQAQREAKRQKLSYSVSFGTNSNNIPQIAVYPRDSDPTNYWQNLTTNLGIQSGKIVLGTNLTGKNTTTSSTSVSYASAFNSRTPQTITFDYMGALDFGSLVTTNSNSLTSVQQQNLGYNSTIQNYKGLIVAVAVAKSGVPTQATNVKRCVIVKTLLGSIQTGKDTDCS